METRQSPGMFTFPSHRHLLPVVPTTCCRRPSEDQTGLILPRTSALGPENRATALLLCSRKCLVSASAVGWRMFWTTQPRNPRIGIFLYSLAMAS
jgi:hypothetical protein